MQTAVVSGRVEVDTKARVDAVLRREGLTVAQLIKAVWADIATRGELPESICAGKAAVRDTTAFDEFAAFVDALPAAPSEFTYMTDAQMKQMLGDRHA